MMSADCVFCRIVAGQVPASKVHEDELTLAFMDIGQVNPGHVIVATRPHVENVYGLDDELAAAVFRTATRVAKAVKASLDPEGMNLFQANGKAGWQTVFHFHIHVLPRRLDDGMKLQWPATHPPREELERVAAQIRGALQSA
jgi:histidine triad (HIT) family protein